MMEEFAAWVGFSDHSCDPEVPALAVAAGAVMIEKHFSLDPARPGFDHAISVDLEGLSNLVRRVRKAEICLGQGNKVCVPDQMQAAERYLRKIVARRDISVGETLDLSNVGFMRTPNGQGGLSPAAWEEVAGKLTAHPMRRYQTIRLSDLLDP
jgi:sialic acid synthase SpsE